MLEEEGSQSFDLPAVLQPASQSQSQTREGGRERKGRAENGGGEKEAKGNRRTRAADGVRLADLRLKGPFFVSPS